jgi:hypothetical protein
MSLRYESDSQALHGQFQDHKPDRIVFFRILRQSGGQQLRELFPFLNQSSIILVHANLSAVDAPWTLQLCWLTKRCWRPSAGSMSC